jgi:DNA-binding HxlR family transcriptional regulator
LTFTLRPGHCEIVRTYGHACALAKALDLVGDRWTLLIVRELMLSGACRYTDLQYGLPGIATNLLAERLNELTEAGLVSREAAPPPIATALFRLTERGAELEPVLLALAQWGAPLLATASKKDAVRGHWLALSLRSRVRDKTPSAKTVRIEVRSGGEPITVETSGDGSVRVRAGSVGAPDATVEGAPGIVLGLLTKTLSLSAAFKKGLKYKGNRSVLGRFGEALPRTTS